MIHVRTDVAHKISSGDTVLGLGDCGFQKLKQKVNCLVKSVIFGET